jgi:superoxide reductase
MTIQKEIYKCDICGNITEVLHSGAGELVCCGEAMGLSIEKRQDIGQEKHIPIIEKKEDGLMVRVGSIQHPMSKDHYIEWIEIITNNTVCKKFLNPGDSPEAFFKMKIGEREVKARAYCNIHKLWQK